MNFYDATNERWITDNDPVPFKLKGPVDTGAHADQPTRDKYASRGFSEFSEVRAGKEALIFVTVSLLFAVPLILAGIMLVLN